MALADALAAAAARPAAKMGNCKVLTLDIETRPHLAHVWALWDQNVGLSQIAEVGTVICFAAKWAGEKRVHFWSDHHDGHDEMVRQAWAMIDAADVIVGYNHRSFDLKHLHREFVLAGLAPPSPHRDVDLLTVARSRFKFASNKLDHVASELGLGSKVNHSGFDLWLGCMAGDPKAWATMRKYNIGDVRLTEAVYDHLRPWIKNPPHPGLYGGAVGGCPSCGGDNLVPNGTHKALARQYQLLRCTDCGASAQGAVISGTQTTTRSVS